jgi:hypothetical protein
MKAGMYFNFKIEKSMCIAPQRRDCNQPTASNGDFENRKRKSPHGRNQL